MFREHWTKYIKYLLTNSILKIHKVTYLHIVRVCAFSVHIMVLAHLRRDNLDVCAVNTSDDPREVEEILFLLALLSEIWRREFRKSCQIIMIVHRILLKPSSSWLW